MEIRPYSAYNEQEIAALYASVGWTAYLKDLPALRAGFEASLLTLAAYDGGRLLGLIRAVGDGHTVVLIQDLLVYPEDQGKGVGRALLDAVLERYPDVRQIELVTDDTEKTKAFYRAAGFRDLADLGCRGFMRM